MGITSKQRGRHIFDEIGFSGGTGILKMAQVVFDPTANAGQRAIAAYPLGGFLPNGAIVVGGFLIVNTTFVSAGGDAGTIAVHVNGANDIVVAIAISDVSNVWDAGKRAIIPKVNTPEATSITLTAARQLAFTVAGQVLTGGKATLVIFYI